MRHGYGGIILSAVIVAAFLTVTGETFGSSIYFDIDSDLVADTEHTMGVGQDVVVSVCLSGFTEETGSFQFDIFYDGSVLELLDYDTYMGQPDEDPGLMGTIQTKAELGPWGTSQWSSPVTQEVNEYDSGWGSMREFYTAGSFTETAGGDGILAYLVFDAVGLSSPAKCRAILKGGGRYVSTLPTPSGFLSKLLGIIWRGPTAVTMLVEPDGAELERLSKLVETGQLKPIVAEIFPLARVGDAQQLSESGHVRGKIVLTVRE